MTIPQAFLSGIVQGITEFFPISSSGHLVILHTLFGIVEPQVDFDIFLHFGTLLSTLIFFRKDILTLFKKENKTLYFIIAGSLPTLIIGILFKDMVEGFFGMPKVVGAMLVLTGGALILATVYAKRNRVAKNLGILNSVMIGIAQGISIIPGISRSGATLATGIFLGLDSITACKFSFLLAIPAIGGANLVKMRSLGINLLGANTAPFLIGGLTSMIVGLASVKILLKLVKDNKLHFFGAYCVVVGLFVTIFLYH